MTRRSADCSEFQPDSLARTLTAVPFSQVPAPVIEFHRIAKGVVRNGVQEKRFKSGEQWEVLRQKEGTVIVGKNGVEKQLPLDQTGKFSVFEREKITLAVGDRNYLTGLYKVPPRETACFRPHAYALH